MNCNGLSLIIVGLTVSLSSMGSKASWPVDEEACRKALEKIEPLQVRPSLLDRMSYKGFYKNSMDRDLIARRERNQNHTATPLIQNPQRLRVESPALIEAIPREALARIVFEKDGQSQSVEEKEIPSDVGLIVPLVNGAKKVVVTTVNGRIFKLHFNAVVTFGQTGVSKRAFGYYFYQSPAAKLTLAILGFVGHRFQQGLPEIRLSELSEISEQLSESMDFTFAPNVVGLPVDLFGVSEIASVTFIIGSATSISYELKSQALLNP